MKEFPNGVSWYSYKTAQITVGFPEGDECCHWCKYIKKTTGIDRKECVLTGDIIYNEHLIPPECPFIKAEEEQNEHL